MRYRILLSVNTCRRRSLRNNKVKKERGSRNSKMGKLVIISIVLLLGCNYKTNPTDEGRYLRCVEYSGCNNAGIACWINFAIIEKKVVTNTRIPPVCLIQTQLCKKRCLQCVANSGARGDSTNCKFPEFKILYTDYSDGIL